MECNHEDINQQNCNKCGAFCTIFSQAIKEEETNFEVEISLQELYTNMWKNQAVCRIYKPESHYLHYRRLLVDWMCEVGEKYKLSNLTIHTSIAFIDTLFSNMSQKISRTKWQIFGVVSLITAAKIEEKEDNIPQIRNIINVISKYEIKQAERELLIALNWNLMCHTPMHFINFFIAQGIIFSSDLHKQALDSRIAKYVRKYCEFFADLSLQSYDFVKYPSVILACSCIAAARKAVSISPIWSNELQQLTKVEYKEIQFCLVHLYQFYRDSFPSEANSEGDGLKRSSTSQSSKQKIIQDQSQNGVTTQVY